MPKETGICGGLLGGFDSFDGSIMTHSDEGLSLAPIQRPASRAIRTISTEVNSLIATTEIK
jgi:hypothetical protein